MSSPRPLLRFAFVYAALFAPLGLVSPCLGPYFQSRGIDAATIGAMMGAGAVTGAVGSHLSPLLVDRIGRARIVLATLSVLTGLCYVGVGLSPSPLIAMAAWALAAMFASGATSILTGLAVNGLRHHRLGYAAARSTGSFSAFAVMAASGVAVAAIGLGHVPLAIAALQALAVAAYAAIPSSEFTRKARTATPIGALLRSPGVIQALLANALLFSTHAGILSYGPMFWRDAGYSATQIGLMVSASVPSEIVGMLVAGLVLARTDAAESAVAFCCVAACARWAIMGFADLGYGGTLAVQTLHGLSYGFGSVAGIRLLATRMPASFDVMGQGMQITLNTLLFAAMTFLGGRLYQDGQSAVFAAMACVALCAGVTAILTPKRALAASPA